MKIDRSDLSVYFDKRMLRILLLGIIQGFPWVIILSILNIWLKEYGVSKTTIGFSGLIFFVYSINWIWAPLVDRINIPLLSNNIGQRKSWIMLMQLIILISLISWTNFNPSDHLFYIILLALVIACSSATQDIQLDALRKELRENGIIFKITKNRITKLSVKETTLKELEKFFTGPTAAAISSDPFMSA